jgi:predicted enzyme related to lactoylglutathione lyase
MTETTPLITGVDFVCIPAKDFDAMTAFYGETLGLPFVKRYGSRPGAEYQAGNLTLAIMRAEDFGATFSPNAMPIALQVDDVGAARERLEAKGVRFVSDTFDSGVCWQAICLDPDGNPLRCTTATRRKRNPPRPRSRLRTWCKRPRRPWNRAP